MSLFSTILLILLGLLVTSFPLLSRILAEKSGWKALEKHFRTDKKRDQLKGSPINIYKAIIGGLSYNNILRCKVTKSGLYMALVWPFSLSHNPIIIPWDAFKSVEDHKMVLGIYKRIRIGLPAIATIDLDEKRFNLLKKHLRERSRLNV